MTAILLQAKNIDKKVIDLIYEKQLEFTKALGRRVSLDKTVEKIIKDRYGPELKKST